MKRLIAIMLACVFVLSAAGCSHTHKFELSEAESTPVGCLTDGLEVKICSCGERQETKIEATGHDMMIVMDVKPGCTRPGSTDYKCTNCGKMEYTNVDPLGHKYEEAPSEPSRVRRCTNEGCLNCVWTESNNKHEETLTFNFTKEDEAAIDAKYNEVLAKVNAAVKYDPALHGYA